MYNNGRDTLYRIHGTNLPYGVGRRVSSGCIRMYPADIETLFNSVSIGTPVRVVNQPAKLGWIDGELYLEVHPEGEQLDELEVNYSFEPRLTPEFEEIVARAAGDQVDRVDWSVVVRTWAHRTGVPMRITRAPGEDVIGEAPPPRVARRASERRDPGGRGETSYSRLLPAVPDPTVPATERPIGGSPPRGDATLPAPLRQPPLTPWSPRPSAPPTRMPGDGVW